MRRHIIYSSKQKQEAIMKIIYRQKDGWFTGHVQEYPEYESQGKTLDELQQNLIDIYNDIINGLVEDAEPFQVLEVVV
jgi:predicted RNase H-like HicB family nuclease